ncbi:MAG: PepSY-associated TM helix domain-containing protein [Sphingopyxis sp.]|uniref:PepSY-associated TM helix domain-containing protein n=1 Tax=Sphingopyxis sp. TaxID=1908224 RepID=UPI002AB98E1B|nr:PepSY-associated TM helix domain-containing protein [Sphingopyxis sp.]MDZ3832678.1 PepSY-associated TM helix domain-containing protein [Sphingopyxis sp.]
MSVAVDKDVVKRALSAHAAVGLLAGALLYLISLTGTLLVFYDEWQRIEQPNAPEMIHADPDAAARAAASILAREDASGIKPTTHLYLHLPTSDLPRTTVITDTQAWHVDGAGRLTVPEENGWSDFLLHLHYRLHLPSTLGITIVGGLGVMMVGLIMSGVLAHPRIFRDAFRLRARSRGGVGLADWHNRLGVWTLPFTLAIAVTGAAIGLGSVVSFGLAEGFYKGKVEDVYTPIFGRDAVTDEAAAPLPDIAAALRTMKARFPDVAAYYVIVHDPRTKGQMVQIIAEHPRRLIYGDNYYFDDRGRFTGSSGLSDGKLGQQIAASNYKLHFGNYGGLTVKIAYALLGLALCVMTATGLSIWIGKRERRGLHQPRLRGAWDGVVWGTPVILALCFVTRIVMGNAAPLVAIFWVGLAFLLAGAIAAAPHWPVKRFLARMAFAGGAAALIAGLAA